MPSHFFQSGNSQLIHSTQIIADDMVLDEKSKISSVNCQVVVNENA